MATDPHDHRWGDARSVAPRTARMCMVEGCTQWAVAWRKKWRPPRAAESVSLLARVIEDLAIYDAMRIMHGPEKGARWARRVRGYDRG